MGDELSTQPVPKSKRYDYEPLVGFLHLLLACGGIAVGLACIGYGVFFYINKMGDWWFPILMGASVAWFMLSTLKFTFEKNRPIVIDETGVSAMAFGRVWKSFTWPEVKRIEKIWLLQVEELGFRYGFNLRTIGPNDSIMIEDKICELPALLSALNAYVQRYQISLLTRDKRDDTRAKIKATVKDKQERKKLLKEGVQSSIDAL